MPLTDASTSLRMSIQRRRDTEAEMMLRRLLHARGLRYRVDLPLPGMPRRRADLTFSAKRVAVFVDGCFWHGCPEHGTEPKRNGGWWASKLARNIERDRETDAYLAEIGWTVVRIWEHEDPECAADFVEAVVRSEKRRSQRGLSDTPGM
ncbi:very short patch repair endonuclease [Mycobacterium sp. UM_Kg27]|uniref:very short patch repair endonuclease n=1 Tax=Mycobacterium sp. UM_Kg27 TaxID=1545693 RepID=UPI00061B0905|nr:very short patch repair endonuclease [Mycobacterium sp. UM_Kg27]